MALDEMIGNFLVQLFLLISLRDITNLFVFKKKDEAQQKAERLDELRNKHDKTLAEKKEFIQLKEKGKNFSWRKFVFNTVFFVIGFIMLRFIFVEFDIQIKFWIACLIVIPMSLIIGWILYKLKLKEDNLFEITGVKRG